MNFNPRSREGSDADVNTAISQVENISIRAPARGATTASGSDTSSVFDFNPRSREGSDAAGYRGVHRAADFNPRSREGSDVVQIIHLSKWHIFQSALPRGERHVRQILDGTLTIISIRAPARGATKFRQQFHQWESISIRAPARGATRTIPKLCSKSIFQSALPRGERLDLL